MEYIVKMDDYTLILIESIQSNTLPQKYVIKLYKFDQISNELIKLSDTFPFNQKLDNIYHKWNDHERYLIFQTESRFTKYDLIDNTWNYYCRRYNGSNNIKFLFHYNNQMWLIDNLGTFYTYNELKRELKMIPSNNEIKHIAWFFCFGLKMRSLDYVIFNKKYEIIFVINKHSGIFCFSLKTLKWKHLYSIMDSNEKTISCWINSIGIGKLFLANNDDYIVGYKSFNGLLSYIIYDINQNDVNGFKVAYTNKLIGLYFSKENKDYTNTLIHGFIRNNAKLIINAICDIIIKMYSNDYIGSVNNIDNGIQINKCLWDNFISGKVVTF